MSAAMPYLRCEARLVQAPWLLEIYLRLQQNPRALLGDFETTRLFCIAMEREFAALPEWAQGYVAARADGLTDAAVAALLGCSVRTMHRRLGCAVGAA